MREQVMKQLIALLNDNIGQKLTGALATGIAATMNQVMDQIEHMQSAKSTDS